jgi:uncharacterized protein YndB with AHSA1/START domain
MPGTTTTPDLDALVTEIDIAAPPERVFRALTDSAELARWFGNPGCPAKHWKFDPRLGGRYSYATAASSTSGINRVDQFACHGEIVEFDPPRLLAYTWVANWHEDKALETVVRWELTSAGKSTHVKVTHSGLAREAAARKDYSGGWPGVLHSLKQHAEQA